MNIHVITAKYEQLTIYQKETMKKADKLKALSKRLLLELQIRNGGHTNASN